MATHLISSFSSSADEKLKDGDAFYLEYTNTLEEVRRLFDEMDDDDDDDKLLLIDIIQRLALDYHFVQEIEAVCSKICRSVLSDHDQRLYHVSLTFRLLRQAGFDVTQDLFTNFTDEKGKFISNNLSEDTKGLLALYEASHVGLEGEDILDEATAFSSRHLRANLERNSPDDPQSRMVKFSLQNPQNKSIGRLSSMNFLQEVNCQNEWEFLLQDLAKMELIIVGSSFKNEVLQVIEWWDEVGLTRELKSARSEPMKWHMWSMTVLPHPSWSSQRLMLTRPISLVYIVDDIFDLYGTPNQLSLFTQALKRWEIPETEELPKYMKMCLKAILETTHEISHIVFQEHGCDPLDTLKRSWEKLFDAFLREAAWFASGELPNADEYLQNGIVSSGVPMVLSHLFFLMGIDLNKEAQHQLNETDHNSILYSVAMILRLLDDLGNAQDEHQEGYDGSYVECYMKEFGISSYETAKRHVMCMISDTWKRLNKQCLISSSPFPPSFNKACLNAARMVPIMYSYDDNHALPVLEQCIESLSS